MNIASILQDYEDFVSSHFPWFLGIGATAIFALLALHQYRGITRRRKCFDHRNAITEDDWFASFYPAGKGEQAVVREILKAFANEIGIKWTALRPADSFEEVLRIDRRYSPQDDLEQAELRIVSYAEQLGISDQPLPAFAGSLKQFLDNWVTISGGIPPSKAS